MLKDRKKVRKIVIILITLIALLGFYIKYSKVTKETYAPTLKAARASTLGLNYGKINPIYRPKWEKVSNTFDATTKTLSVTVKGSANYTSDVESTLTADNVEVYVDGVKATGLNIQVGLGKIDTNETTQKKEVTHVITISNFEQGTRKNGEPYKEFSGNVALKILGRGKDSSTYNANVLTDEFGNQNMMETDEETGTWVNVQIKDAETTQNTNNVLFADFIAPEFTYEYSSTDINRDQKTLTVDFSVTDKFFKTSKVLENADNIAVNLLDTSVKIANDKITKTLMLKTLAEDEVNGDITYKANGDIYYKSKKVGERYRLVIGGLEQAEIAQDGKYKDYSGPIGIDFPAGMATDNSNNSNEGTSIVIGINEPDGTGNKEIVDVVDPMWKAENIQIDKINKVVKVDLIGTDKYYASNTLTADKITVKIDGEKITTTDNVKKSLSEATPLKEDRTVDGTTSSVQYGVKYTLTLSDWEEANKQDGKTFLEWSGRTFITIAADTLKDQYDNTSNEQEFELGHIDLIQPRIEIESASKDETAKTETIIFNVVDKYINR